jgi:taurine dioxygenase
MTQGVRTADQVSTAFDIRPLKPNIGAEVRGVNVKEPLEPAAIETLHQALAEHGVLVFQDQDLTVEQQMAFGRRFGNLSVHPFSAHLAGHPEVIVLDYTADNPPSLTDIWHSDETFRAEPPMATMLHAKIVPALGGDTLFANMAAAYEGLSAPMKQLINDLDAVHDFKPFRSLFTHSDAHRKRLHEMEDQFPPVLHPVVRIHPVSGAKVLFVNPQFTLHIDGMKADESRALLDLLFRQASVPEYQMRLEWRRHTLALWDNRLVQHYAVHDYYPQRRRLERVTIMGDRPVGPTRRTAALKTDRAHTPKGSPWAVDRRP